MQLMADGLLFASAMIAALYCLVLSRRLGRLTDSSAGIGLQIAALDRALAETRAALAETRDGVAELRASARAAIAELRRGSETGEQIAARLDEETARAEAVLRRLYEADERLEAHERRQTEGAGVEGDAAPGAADVGETVLLEARRVTAADGEPRVEGLPEAGTGRAGGRQARHATAAAPAGAGEGRAGDAGEKGLRP